MLMLLCGLALGQSLDQARDAAARAGLDLERARAAASAAHAQAWGSLAGSLPSVAAFASVNTGAGLTAFGFPRPVTTQTGLGLEGSWTLVNPSGWAAAGAARSSAQGQDAMVDWALVEARRQATSAYMLALLAQDRVERLEKLYEDAQAVSDAGQQLVQAGLRAPSDGARLQAEAAQARAAFISAQGEARARCAELQGLMRAPITGTCTLSAPSIDQPQDSDQPHPALRAAEAAVLASRGLTRSEALGAAPTLGLSGTAAQYAADGGDPGLGWSVTVKATQPLLAGGDNAADLSLARANLRAAELELEAQEQALAIARLSAEARWTAAQASLESQTEAYAAAARVYELSQSSYEAGLLGTLQWLDARAVYTSASLNLLAAQAELGLAFAELEAARGVW